MKSLKHLVSLFLILGLAIAAFPAYRAHAQIAPATASSSTLCIESNGVCPANVGANVGQTFTTDIVFTNAACLTSYQMDLAWDPSVMNAVNLAEGNWADGHSANNFANTIDNSIGTLEYGSALLGTSVNFTTATLFTVTWQIIGLGATSITNANTIDGVSTPLLTGLTPCPTGGITLLPQPSVTIGSAHNNPLTLCVQSSGICPANVKAPVGGSFAVDVVLSNVNLLVGYQVELDYNPSVLNAISVTEGTWPGAATAFNFVNTVDNSLGTLTYGSALLGATTNVTSATLFTVTFSLVGAGSSTVIAPVIVSVDGFREAPLMSGIGVGQPFVLLLPQPSITNGMATNVPAKATLTDPFVTPAFHNLKISHNGNVQTLTAFVNNTGTVTAYVQMRYTITSSTGSVSFVSSGILAMPVGTHNAPLSVAYTVPSLPATYHVIGKLFVSADGVNFTFSGSSRSLSYKVS